MVEQLKLKVLESIFYPKSVAVLGVSDSPQRVGYNLFESLLQGGFPGNLYPVHPRLESVFGRRVYHSLAEIPEKVDLALIALNERATLAALKECGEKGVKGAICVAGGYREVGEAGADLEEELRALARRYGIGLIGPNTLGIINTDADLYATFYPLRLPKGAVSFISQSGGMGLTFMHRAADIGLGLNKWVGVGNRATFGFADYLSYLGQDPSTRAIGIFLEGTEDAGAMVRVAAEIGKPVVVYKVGRAKATDHACLTHTGTLAGSYRLYRDIFRQFGIYAVDSVAEMVASLKALSLAPLPAGNRVGIMTHTAGPSIVAADELLRRGCHLPSFAAATLEAIERLTGPSPPFVLKNPLDVAGFGFAAEAYGQYLDLVVQDPGVDVVLAIYCEHKNWRFPSPELVQTKEKVGKPIVACYAARNKSLEEERKFLERHGIPLFGTPEEAAWGVAALVAWAEWLRRKAV